MHHNQIAEKTVIKEKLTLEGKKDTFTYKGQKISMRASFSLKVM